MRIATWNCQGGLARKQAAIAELEPDVLVVPESARPVGWNGALGADAVRSVEWVGENPRKGLAAISFGDYSLRVHESYEPSHRWVLPLVVEGPFPFTLFAVWTVPHLESRFYVQCLFDSLETYRGILAGPRVIWAGDFNNNPLLDKPRHALKFSDLVERMRELGLRSLYHAQTSEAHGGEANPTFYLQRKVGKPHHIDYIVASRDICELEFEVSVGTHSKWSKWSDHMPLVASIRERSPGEGS